MTREQENAINELQRMKMDKSHTGSEYNAIKTAIQAIKDLDKMNGIALDLASENDDLIEKLDSIRAEIESIEHYGTNNGHDFWVRTPDEIKKDVLTIIDKYRVESEG